ncbi:MAG: hypothetical protein AAGA76_15460 [Pseudomonadota bacterium]
MNMGKHHTISGIPAALSVLFLAGLLSACVSDTLSTVDTQPKPVAENVSYDPAQRDQAVAEIREKAAQSGSGELTNAFVDQDGPNEPLTASEQAQLINELEQSAQRNSGSVTDAELEAKQRSIRELQQKARTHYDSAVNNIQN